MAFSSSLSSIEPPSSLPPATSPLPAAPIPYLSTHFYHPTALEPQSYSYPSSYPYPSTFPFPLSSSITIRSSNFHMLPPSLPSTTCNPLTSHPSPSFPHPPLQRAFPSTVGLLPPPRDSAPTN
ncbi:hypothetical protein AMTRI_Chr07g27480 [Amborella trichopoda]|uniref:Uncharacterized protein n=1 Tax=Amborella trichopoda TaxID=13333 RepID=W1NNN5_AMBTC|nr:hypothetical protein AMTR_s00124p00016870 [Amborella trichopoda]